MIRLEGDKVEFTGVVAGMSGSPCSIDGKLVGALGYAFAAFAKEPIAGVTPIQDMLDKAATGWRSYLALGRRQGGLGGSAGGASTGQGCQPQRRMTVLRRSRHHSLWVE